MVGEAAQEQKKKRTFRKFVFRGVDLEQLLEMDSLVVLIFKISFYAYTANSHYCYFSVYFLLQATIQQNVACKSSKAIKSWSWTEA